MAFPTSPFSIREYALKMRGKDISKSWPFGEEMAEVKLPPMTVTKYRWWSRELKILRSNIETTTKETKTKGKSRTPKKRSIAEIFAVAPQVETMMVIGNDCEVEKEIERQVIGDKVKAKSLARTLVSAMKTINANNKNNKTKDFGHEQLRSRGQRNRKDVSVRRKKPCYKRLSRQNRKKVVKKSNAVAKQQRSMPPVKSILKQSVKLVSETNPSSTNLKCSDQVINNGGQKLNRRVSFSDKDDVLGTTTKPFSDTVERNDESRFEASEGTTKLGEGNEGVSSIEVGVNDSNGVSFRVRREFDSQHMKGKNDQLPHIHDPVDAQSSMRSHHCWGNADHSPEQLISANRVIPRENNLHLFDHVYANGPDPKRPSAHSAVPAVRNQRGSSFWPRVRENSVDDHFNNPINGVAALNSITSTVPSFASSENAVGRFLNLVESSATDTRCRFPNWEQTTVAYKEDVTNDGFVCLPLNSKGELIQLNSGFVNRFDQINEASNNMDRSSRMPICGLVVPRNSGDYFIDNEKLLVDTQPTGNQLTLFPLHSDMQENRNRYLSAGFYVDEPGMSLADIRRINSERGTESGRFFNRCRHLGMLHNQNVNTEMYPENPARQTMRLMGKDVAIGGNGKEVQEPEVINFWKNSTSIENCLTNPIQENPMRKRNFLKDRMFYSAGFHGNQVAQRTLLANSPQVRYPHPQFDQKNRTMYQRSDSVINLNERFDNIHVVSPSSTNQATNMAPSFQAPFIFSHQMCSNNYETLGFNQNQHPEKKGNFNFPFLQPDDENLVHLPWMLHGRPLGEAPTVNSERVNIDRYGYYNNPFLSSDTDVFTSPSPTQHPCEAAYPCRTMPSHLHMKNMPTTTPFFQPISIASRVQPPPIRTSTEDRSKFNTFTVQDTGLSTKRHAADLFDSRKRQKISSLEMNNDSIVHGWSTKGKFMDDVQSNPETKEKIHAYWEKAVNSAGHISNLSQIDEVEMICSSNEAVKVECMGRSGPIKLTAGAKHILKPSQSMDLDNTKPTYSKIQCVSLAESQKSTKVYSF